MDDRNQPRDLKTVLAQDGPLDPARAVHVVRQVAAAIDAAHAHQTVHRAVTPATIWLAGDDSVFLADTGKATPSTDRTRTLVTNTEATYRADIAALAEVLYECLSGRPPDTSGAPVGLPAGLDDVIAKGLAADSDDGYPTAAELAAAAQRALAAAPHPLHRPADAATRTIQLPPPPPSPNPVPPQWDPIQGRSNTVSYPHSRPIQLPPPPRRRRHFAPVLAVVIIVGAVVAGAIVIPRLVRTQSAGAAHPSSTSTRATAAAPRRTYSGQPIVLPFPGLHPTKNVAVDGAGNIYVLASPAPGPDAGMFNLLPAKLFKLTPGGGEAATLEFPGVNFRTASDLAVDKAGNIYFSDGSQVWLLESGKSSPIRLPFRGFSSISAIAVDAAGNAYATGGLLGGDSGLKYGVKKLAPGENRPTDLSFGDLYLPRGIAVDNAGNVYICAGVKGSGHGHILKLPAGATAATALSIPELIEPRHVAFDSAGNMFITDGFGRGFYELPATGGTVKVPLAANSHGVAVDSTDTLYVLTSAASDKSDQIVIPGQVLKIPPDS